MPELPDITLYLESLQKRICGAELLEVFVHNPFFLRSVITDDLTGRVVCDLQRLGKRIAIGLQPDCWLVIHLMIAGRLQWSAKRPAGAGRNVLADLVFSNGNLRVTEAGSKRRASLYVVSSRELPQHDPGGLEVLDTSFEQFADRLRQRNHTLKRSLTDPRIFSGIGNAYSDEILHHARLSPFAQSKKLSDQQVRQLHQSVVHVLQAWISRLRLDSGERFPRRITAFRDGMAVHGRYGKPCPDCDATVQRIRYAGSETNYCPGCQTGGRILADRSLSRLLKDDWPRTVDELEKIRPRDK